MGVHFRVSELAGLYGLNSDTLRYYEEQGLLHPGRSENGYRQYGIADLCDLNIIRSLRALDMSVEDMRGYLKNRSARGTGEMLLTRRRIMEEKIAVLQKELAAVEQRCARLEEAMSLPVGRPEKRRLPRRDCVLLREPGTPEAEVDYLLKKLERRHRGLLKELGSRQMGAVPDRRAMEQGRYDRYEAVFFLCEPEAPFDECLPEGDYLCLVHAGAYGKIGESYRALYTAAENMGLRPADAPVELYLVDIHDTADETEFRTELQLRVKTGE
ncbi:MAG: MerR family transcriptional regulator [Candidatus Heteroscillospira sp.]|jgi:DNA-binding transcriptional MerR regulator